MSRSGCVRSWEIVAVTLLAVFALGLSACGRRRHKLPTPGDQEDVGAGRQHPLEVIPDKWEQPPAQAPRVPVVRAAEVVEPTFEDRVRRGEASLGSAVQTSGPGVININAVGRVVRGNTGGIRACYERELTRNPTLSGRLELRFVIGVDGRTTEVTTTGLAGAPAVTSCIAGRVRGLVFPMPEGGDVSVEVPVTLTPGG